ncbi:MAG: hypothetical protein JW913_08885 [Chitinispirillaceae bacterium]|nr:hypothetical protein [Chitinispirillaceae bacterium]
MVQELTVTCPHCRQVAEIFLSTNACVIILNCPSCCSPIMYFDQKIFILSDNQVEAIKNRTRSSAMMNMLKQMTRPEEFPIKKTAACNGGASVVCGLPSGTSSFTHTPSKIHIGSDDITNLKIELALCNDIQEFIDRI